MGGKNEDARVVLLTEDRTKPFSEYHVSKSGGHQGRDRTEDKLRHLLLAALASGHTLLGKCMHAYICHQAYMYSVHVHALLVVCVIYVPRRAPWPVLDVQCFGLCVVFK